MIANITGVVVDGYTTLFPTDQPIQMPCGEPLTINLSVFSSNGNPYDITLYTPMFSMNYQTGVKLINLSGSSAVPTTGVAVITLTYDLTQNLMPANYKYDIVLVPNNLTEPPIHVVWFSDFTLIRSIY